MPQRRHHGGAFQTQTVVMALTGHRKVNQIARAGEMHPLRVAKWRAEVLARLPRFCRTAPSEGPAGFRDRGSAVSENWAADE
jgi:hypothetical protein